MQNRYEPIHKLQVENVADRASQHGNELFQVEYEGVRDSSFHSTTLAY